MPTIEQNLERIATALEKIAANGGSLAGSASTAASTKPAETTKAADKPAETKPADKPAETKPAEEKAKPKNDKDAVRKALQAYREIEGTPAMLEVLKKHGAANLNDLAEDQYDAVVAAVS